MNDDWRLDPLVARVVAWHNRHPLARRITPHQVRSLGYVALPFAVSMAADAAVAAEVPTPAGTAPAEAGNPVRLRERAAARAQQPAVRAAGAAGGSSPQATALPQRRGAMTAAFSEDFIAPIAPARVARWAARHARPGAAAPGSGPLRRVSVDDARVPFGHRVVMCHAMTAAIDSGGQRTRLLLGPDPRAAVLGRRLWSRPRAAAAGAAALAGLSLALALFMGSAQDDAPALPQAAAAVPATASGASRGGTAADTLAVTAGAAPASAAAAAASMPGSAWLAGDAGGNQTPVDVEPRLGRIELPRPVPAIEDVVHAAASQARAAIVPPQAAAEAGVPASSAVAPPGRARSTAATAAAVPQDSFWAVTTRPLRTRAESLQWLQAVDGLLRPQGGGSLQVEMLAEGEDWRVVGWPFTRRADAERARALLLARGLRVEVVDF